MTHDLRSMTASEVVKVAESLSDAQRRDLADGNCAYFGNAECLCRSPHRVSLAALGLVEQRDDGLFGAIRTEMGLAVRDYLRRTG